MRPIKFRGRRPNGELVYGDLIQCNGDPSILTHTHRVFVESNSVAQLVGYDKDGREIYEGDTLVDRNDRCKPPYDDFTVEFKVHGYKHNSCLTFEVDTSLYGLKGES